MPDEIQTQNPQTTESILDQANKAVQELKAEREKIEAVRNELREIETRRILSGKSGAPTQVVEKVDTPKEYADKVMRGEIKAK